MPPLNFERLAATADDDESGERGERGERDQGADEQQLTPYTAPAGQPRSTGQVAKVASSEHTDRVERMRAVFDTIDRDHDGAINVRELLLALRKHPGVSEFLHLPMHVHQEGGTRETFEEMFQAIDKDGSRDVTWPEFQAYFASRLSSRGGRKGGKTEAQDGEEGVLAPPRSSVDVRREGEDAGAASLEEVTSLNKQAAAREKVSLWFPFEICFDPCTRMITFEPESEPDERLCGDRVGRFANMFLLDRLVPSHTHLHHGCILSCSSTPCMLS